MRAERDDLGPLVESWSDGKPVAWDQAESGARDDGERRNIRAFREVTRIAAFNRALQRHGATPAARPGPERWGSLLLLERIGRGAAGEVFRAWDPALEREVALKRLAPGAPGTPALLGEARALARVRHPHVVAVHGIEEHEGTIGLRMEYLAGRALDAEIGARGALPVAEVMRVGVQIAHALAAADAAGVVHRDVKPANIVLEGPDRAVLTDFGLGRRPALAADAEVPGSGTPMYMSPERLSGGEATAAGDVYGLGATLWHALAGRPPFVAVTLDALRAAVARGPAEPLARLRADAPAPLVAAIERAMAPDPRQRFASARALADALAVAAAPRPVHPATARRAWPVPALAAAAVLVLAAVFGPRLLQRPAARVPPAPVAPPAVVATFDVAAAFMRRGATHEPLADGDPVAPGDHLSLSFHATRPTWVYVLNEDERGESYLLFPSPAFDLANPVPPNAEVLLPGSVDGKPTAWTVTSRGGREHFLVVASLEPVPELESEVGRMRAPSAGRPVDASPVAGAVIERMRGVGGVSEIRDDPRPRRAGGIARFRRLAGRETGVRGVWVREIALENPLR